MPKATILLADDDTSILTVVERALKRQGYAVETADTGEALMEAVRLRHPDLLITDVVLPVGDDLRATAFDLLPQLRELRPDLPIIVISAQNTLVTAVRANELGAFDYLPKPFDLDHLIASVEKALSSAQAITTPSPAKSAHFEELVHPAIIGTSGAMQHIYRTLGRMVGVDLTVMITGESGTGKELVARALHDLGPRSHKPFIAINMAAIPKELVESELFGHEKGAFTGAVARKSGVFERAEGGTVFLDEIGDMPLDAQSKLLRVLQQGEFMTVGGTRTLKTNIRIICATHRDLLEAVRAGRFREDLYYRLNVVPVMIPPLKARKDDIDVLARHFLRKAANKGLPEKTLSPEALGALKRYDWPGNVRELENAIYRLCVLVSESMIGEDAVLQHMAITGAQEAARQETFSLETSVAEHLRQYFHAHEGDLPPPGLYVRILALVERPLINQALEATNGNQLKAAWLLGINRNTLRKKMQELSIGWAQRAKEG